jgi:hypothetical protein
MEVMTENKQNHQTEMREEDLDEEQLERLLDSVTLKASKTNFG